MELRSHPGKTAIKFAKCLLTKRTMRAILSSIHQEGGVMVKRLLNVTGMRMCGMMMCGTLFVMCRMLPDAMPTFT